MMVQAKPNPIAKRKERLRALQAATKLASTDQRNEKHDKQPHDTTTTK
jgi:hypothetical protein